MQAPPSKFVDGDAELSSTSLTAGGWTSVGYVPTARLNPIQTLTRTDMLALALSGGVAIFPNHRCALPNRSIPGYGQLSHHCGV